MSLPRPRSADELRQRLAGQLTTAGHLRTDPWRQAVEAVAREAFLGDRIYRRVDDADHGTQWHPVLRRDIDPAQWLELAHTDETWVTQVDGEDRHDDHPVQGSPSSSSTLPSLVVGMLEDLDVYDGMRVLEIGTGTGYSTALLCHRLGDENVTSIEVDPQVAARAASSLAAAGYQPTLLHADGLTSNTEHRGYDRIIATCSVRTLPTAWLEQSRLGGRILAPICGWLYGSGLALLTVTSPGHASGRFLPGTTSFMLARDHQPPAIIDPPDRTGDTRPTTYGGEVFTDWTSRFLTQLAAPHARRLGFLENDDLPATELLVDYRTGSYAWLTPRPDGWTVTQHGPTRLWDTIEHAISVWTEAGRPPQRSFGLTVTPDGQTVTLDFGADTASWKLPVPTTSGPTGDA